MVLNLVVMFMNMIFWPDYKSGLSRASVVDFLVSTISYQFVKIFVHVWELMREGAIFWTISLISTKLDRKSSH